MDETNLELAGILIRSRPAVFEDGQAIIASNAIKDGGAWWSRLRDFIPQPPDLPVPSPAQAEWLRLIPQSRVLVAGRIGWGALAGTMSAIHRLAAATHKAGPGMVRVHMMHLCHQFSLPFEVAPIQVEGFDLTGLWYSGKRPSAKAVRLFISAELGLDREVLNRPPMFLECGADSFGRPWISLPEDVLWRADAAHLLSLLLLKLRFWTERRVFLDWAARHPD